MHRIARLTDADVLGTPGLSQAKPRLTARAIVMSPTGRCALMYAAKYGIHTLPGGGVEEGETVEEALQREIHEETGCAIAGYEPLGYVEENRFHADYTQISYYIYCSHNGRSPSPAPDRPGGGQRHLRHVVHAGGGLRSHYRPCV